MDVGCVIHERGTMTSSTALPATTSQAAPRDSRSARRVRLATATAVRPQHTVSFRGELLDEDVTDQEIEARIRANALTRVRRGAYRKNTAPRPTPGDDALNDTDPYGERQHLRRARAAWFTSPTLVISHVSATLLHGLPIVGRAPERVHLMRNARTGGGIFPDKHVHAARLLDDDIVAIDGVTATSVGRTLLDLARTSPITTAVVAADDAVHRGVITVAELRDRLRSVGPIRGSRRAARALALIDGRSESSGESRTRVALALQGLPPEQVQIEIFDADGVFVGRADFGYASAGVLVEYDGRSKYGELRKPGETTLDVVLAEKRREEALTGLGWLVMRITAADLAHPEDLARRVTRACAQRTPIVAAGGLSGSWKELPPRT